VASALDLAAELGHERVLLISERAAGLRAVVAIHSTALGPGVGGTRLRAYPSFDDAAADALRLSRAMTYKSAYAGLPFGGAKAVLDADPATAKSPALLEAFARATAELEGRFVTGGDMGIDPDDLRFMARFSRVFEHAPAGAGPDPSELTALGVHAAIAAVAARLGLAFAGLEVAIQGVGEVGGRLARRLAAAGARLTLADAVPARARALAAELGATLAAPETILETRCDVLSPNAAGGVLDEASAERLACRAVVGAANNPLASSYVGYDLAARGILYAPDFVVSAGGVLSLLGERGELDEASLRARVERIGADLAELLDAAAREGVPPFRLAERRVEERLAAARAARRHG
jgi:leucine dehydrogenase